jgi:hypothetical protein
MALWDIFLTHPQADKNKNDAKLLAMSVYIVRGQDVIGTHQFIKSTNKGKHVVIGSKKGR